MVLSLIFSVDLSVNAIMMVYCSGLGDSVPQGQEGGLEKFRKVPKSVDRARQAVSVSVELGVRLRKDHCLSAFFSSISEEYR